MAEGKTFICDQCGRSINAWSDGNPYYLDEDGKKCYAYHPDHEKLDRCIGNDSPHLCLACGHEFMVDSLHPVKSCPKCHSTRRCDTFRLEDKKCPYCGEGRFRVDPDSYCES